MTQQDTSQGSPPAGGGKRKLPPTEEERGWYVPPPPKPPSWRDRLSDIAAGMAFPLAVLLFLGGVAALLHFDPFSFRPSGDASAPPLETPDLQRPLVASDPAAGEPAAVSFTTDPSGVTILVDGDSIGTSPVDDHVLGAGAYILSFQHDEYFRRDTLIVVDGGSTASYSFAMRSGRPVGSLAEREEVSSPDVQESSPPQDQTTAQQDAQVPDREPEPQPEPEPEPEPEPAMGSLILSSQPEGSTVLIDGEEVGVTPLTVQREEGSYTVEITHEGHKPYRADVVVAGDASRTHVANLEPLMGVLRILPRPWGSIYIDGELKKSETNVRYTTELPVGTYTVEVRHPSLGRWVEEVTVSGDDQTSIEVDLREEQ